jgi:PST family polysaccharide transporter
VVICLGLIAARWRPTFDVDRATLRGITAFASGIAGFSLLNQIHRYGDNLLVGAFLGSTALGYYSMAYRFIEVPIGQVGIVAQAIVFPVLSKIPEPERFRDVLLRSQKLLVWVVGPLGVCAMAVGDVAVRDVLGPEWRPAGVIVQIFGAIALGQTAGTQVGMIYMARDATRLMFRWALISTPIVFVSFAIGLLGGVKGVAWAYLAASWLLFWPSWQIPGRLIGLGAWEVLRNLKVELGWGFALAGAVLVLRTGVPIHSLAVVVAFIVGLSAVYWIGSVMLDSRLRSEVRQIIDMRVKAVAPLPPSEVNETVGV